MDLVEGYKVGKRYSMISNADILLVRAESALFPRRIKAQTSSRLTELVKSATDAYESRNIEAFTVHLQNIGMLISKKHVVFPIGYELFEQTRFIELLFEVLRRCVSDIAGQGAFDGDLFRNVLRCLNALSLTPEYNHKIGTEALDTFFAVLPHVNRLEQPLWLCNVLANISCCKLDSSAACTLLEFSCYCIKASDNSRIFVPCLTTISNLIKDTAIEHPLAEKILSAAYKAVQGQYSRVPNKKECNTLVADVLFQLTKTGSLPIEYFFEKGFHVWVRHNMFTYKSECFMIIGWFARHYPQTICQFDLTWTALAVDLEPRDEKQLREEKGYIESCAILCWTLTQYLNALPSCANEEVTWAIVRLFGLYWPDADFLFKKHISLLFLAILFHRNDSLLTPENITEAGEVLQFVSDLEYDEELSPCFADTLLKLHRVCSSIAMDDSHLRELAVHLVDVLKESAPDSPQIEALEQTFND